MFSKRDDDLKTYLQFFITQITIIGRHAAIPEPNEYLTANMCIVRCLEMGRRARYLILTTIILSLTSNMHI